MKTIIIFSLICVLFHSAHTQSVEDSTEAQHQILSLLHRQVDGWNKGSIESFMQGYAKFDSLRFASGGNVTYGWNTMLARYKKSYSTKEKMGTLAFTDITIDLLSGHAAIVFGTWKLKRESDTPWGLFTLIFKKINGEWRIVHDHTSSGN